MTLETTTVKKSYDGDGSTVAFPTTFIFWAVTDIEVILLDALGVETTWVEGTEYDLTGGSGAVGTVTVKTVPTDYTPATGETLLIRSNRDDVQDDAFPLGGAFPSVTVEQAFDQLTRLIQQRTEELTRVLTVKKTSELDGIEVPDPVTGQILIGNAAADGYDNSEPSAGSVILDDNDLGTSQTQATSQNSIFEFIKNTAVTMINKTITGIFTGPLTGDVTGNLNGTASALAGTCAPTTMTPSAWPSFRVYLSAAQLNITGSAIVEFDTETFDTNSDFASNKFTPTVEGKYLLTAQIQWLEAVAADVLYIYITKNGSVISTSRINAYAAIVSHNITDVVVANGSTDYFEIVALNSNRDTSDINNLSANSFFSGCRVG